MSLSTLSQRVVRLSVVCTGVILSFLLASCSSNLLAVKTALDKKPTIAVQYQGPSAGVWGTIGMPSAQAAGPSNRTPVPDEFSDVANAVAEGFKQGWGLEDVTVVDGGAAVTSGLLVQVNVQGNYRYSEGKWTLSMNTVIVIRDVGQDTALNGFMGDTVGEATSEARTVEGVTPSKNPSKIYKEAMIPHALLLESLKTATTKAVVEYLNGVKAAKAEG